MRLADKILSIEIDKELVDMFGIIQSLKNQKNIILTNGTPGSELIAKDLNEDIDKERIKVSEYFERKLENI